MPELDPTAPWTDADATDHTGHTIGRFVVLGPLGQGGMGIVLAARDPDLDRKVALKLLHDRDDPTARARLLREARAMAKLAHPNVLPVHEVGTVDGRAFIAMKYAEGGTLRAWLAAEPRSWRDIRDAYVQAGRGLAAAHAAGFVHRDFKPENALVTEPGVVCVADFGLVGIAAGDAPATAAAPATGDAVTTTGGDGARATAAATDPRLTHAGLAMGTPAYMAPEQHAHHDAGAAGDQFAFCVALWEALYGERPVAGATRDELAAASARAADATPPAGRDVPPWLCEVVRRGLQRDPAARWPSMDALLAALVRDPAAVRRRRVWVAAAVAAGALAAAVTTYAATRPADDGALACDAGGDRFAGVWDPTVRAELAVRTAALQSPFASRAFDAVAQRLDDRVAAWRDAHREACVATRVRKDQSDSALDLRDACLDRRFDELAGVVGLLRAPTIDLLDHAASKGIAGDVTDCADATVLARRQPLPAEPARAQVVELERALAADRVALQAERHVDTAAIAARVDQATALGYAPATAAALYDAALEAKSRNAFADARGHLERALPLADAGGDDPLRFEIADQLTTIVGARLEQFADGLRYGDLAAGVAKRLPASAMRDAKLDATLADVYWRKGELPHAKQLAEQAVAIGERLDPTSLDTADFIYTLAMIHNDSDDPHGGIELVNRAAALIANRLGTDAPSYAQCLNVRGAAERRSGHRDDAEADFHRAIAIYRATKGDGSIDLGIVYTNLGSLYDSRHDFDKAIAEQRLALAVFTRAQGPDGSRTLSTQLRLGDSLSKAKHYDEGGALVTAATAALERTLGRNHPYTANGYLFVGNHDRRIHAYADALVQFHIAEQIWLAVEGADSKNVTRIYQSLGDTYDDLGREDDALAAYEAALAHMRDDATGGATRADIQLALADVTAKAHPDQAAKARALAVAARAGFAALGKAHADDVADADAWLAKHPGH
jgi:tetratricopeptide (TPR) repeat protein|nr:serine/threonine-protein kinase [Kofleriaceae bacterium]